MTTGHAISRYKGGERANDHYHGVMGDREISRPEREGNGPSDLAKHSIRLSRSWSRDGHRRPGPRQRRWVATRRAGLNTGAYERILPPEFRGARENLRSGRYGHGRLAHGLAQGRTVDVRIEDGRIVSLLALIRGDKDAWRRWEGLLAGSNALRQHVQEHRAETHPL